MKSRLAALPRDPGALARRLLLTLLWIGFLALAVAATLAMAPMLALAAERYTVPGERVTIYDLAGRVEVVAGAGSEVVVEVTRGGRDAGTLEIETGTLEGRGTLRVVFPGRRIVYPLGHGDVTNLHVREDGTFGGRDLGFLGRRVTVSNRGSGTEAWADLRILMPRGCDLEVRLAVGEMGAHGVAGDLTLDGAAGAVTASDVKGSLRVDTGSGSVDVGQVEGELSVDTGSGGVRILGAHGPRVGIDTGSGSVEARDVRTDDLIVDTGSGRVTLVGVEADRVRVDTGSGGVMVGLTRDVESLRVDTGSGAVTLRVPDGFSAELEVDTGSGGIDSEVPLTLIHKDHGELRARIGDGRGRVVIDTGSGGVRIVKATGKS
jgi:DUF4097 and DUF4098 domain-containing protein YvlB